MDNSSYLEKLKTQRLGKTYSVFQSLTLIFEGIEMKDNFKWNLLSLKKYDSKQRATEDGMED